VSRRRPSHLKRTIDTFRCGRSGDLAFMWDTGVPYWPRGHVCRTCLRSYRADGSPHGAPGAYRTRAHRERMARMRGEHP
jgi:hypothetical protein